MEKLKLRLLNVTAALLVTLLCGHPALADDTEVLIGTSSQVNVLFIMDTSGSMRWNLAGKTPSANEDSRLDIVQRAFSSLMDSYETSGINVALMRFDSTNIPGTTNNTGGSFVAPMQPLNSTTKSLIVGASNALTAPDGVRTPLAETLYEAALFFRGDAVHFGNIATPNNVSTVLDPDDTTHYLSPITSQCQKNTIILLTDGEPREDYDADTLIETLTGADCGGTDNCLDELAGYLHTNDQSTGIDGIDGIQTVETYTIGLTTDQVLLENTAAAGGGEYNTATNAAQLTTAFEAALGSGIVVDANNTFSPPAMAPSTFNNTSHYNKLFFTLFSPSLNAKWDGNVKPYKLIGSPPQITDADGLVAVGTDGLFLPTSRSFWSSTDDGGSVAAGGANSQLPNANARKLYTYTGDVSPANVTLSAATNALKNNGSSDLTAAMLGLTGNTADADFDAAITATRDSRTIGDPLHSKPALITYGGTESDPDITLFVATNGGFLHAINASTFGNRTDGEEKFAFIPRELLPILPGLASNTGPHPYGLDGDVTAWVQESNADDDHTIEAGEGDHVYVYVGMRRGGSNYYALDVTNRNMPELKWVIKGGGGNEGTTGFSELGQTWSRAAVTTIKYATDTGTGTRKVLIFGGGYDTDQDDHPTGTDAAGKTTYGLADDIGRAIFIVDADTGAKIWQAGPAGSNGGSNPDEVVSEMTNSIPSDVKLVDSDFDGNTDRLYVGDTAGQIFRVDLQATSAGMSGKGVRIANLGSKNGIVAADNRRFFYPPDVVVTQQPGIDSYVSINIGSGYRAGPLNPVNDDGSAAPRVSDRFYSLRDPYVVGAVPTDADGPVFDTITNSDLFNATIDLEGTTAELEHGWFITLGGTFGSSNGEKVLASSITLNGEISFTSYTPPDSIDPTDCAPPAGTGKVYHVSLFDATPTRDSALADRFSTLQRPGIPSTPFIMFRENFDDSGSGGDGGDGGNGGDGGDDDVPVSTGITVTECKGTECDEVSNAFNMEETYWKD